MENFAALRKQRQVAYHDKLRDVAVECREYSRTSYGLQDGVDDSHGDVLLAGIRLRLAKERGGDIHRQSGKRMRTDVANRQINVGDIALFGKFGHLIDV